MTRKVTQPRETRRGRRNSCRRRESDSLHEDQVKRSRTEEEKIWRKFVIPIDHNPECNYADLLIGPHGKIMRSLIAQAGGKVSISLRGRDNNGRVYNNDYEPLHAMIEGESSCVFRAESLIYKRLNITERKIVYPKKPLTEHEVENTIEDGKIVNSEELLMNVENNNSLRFENNNSLRFEDEKVNFIVEEKKALDHEINTVELHKNSQVTIKIEDDEKPIQTIKDAKLQNNRFHTEKEKIHESKNKVNLYESRDIEIPAHHHLGNMFAELFKSNQISIRAHEKDKLSFVLLKCEKMDVSKAESFINDLLKIPHDTKQLSLCNSNDDNYSTSLIDRATNLGDKIGLKFNPDDSLWSKVNTLERQLFCNVQEGSFTDRIISLEKTSG